MNRLHKLAILLSIALYACTPVHLPEQNEYKLTQYGSISSHKPKSSLLITPTEAVAGYQTNAMIYKTNTYNTGAFAYNVWAYPPADMIYALIIQSVYASKDFKNIASGSYASTTVDYRLDTQLLELQQNFIMHPSVVSLKIKASLTSMRTNKLLKSQIFSINIPAEHDNPYAGVVAANKATYRFTLWLTKLIAQ